MKKVIVMGAGWAGVSAAVRLAQSGYQVTVLEQSKRLGGRASSFKDEKSGEVIDNGQHLFMGCYHAALDFLHTIGSLSKLKFQKNLTVNFVDRKARVFSLSCPPLPAPFHLLAGLLSLKSLSWGERLATAKVRSAVARWTGNGELKGMTVDEWLKSLGQSERCRKYFWDFIAIAALNEQSSVAEAESLAVVLKEGFFASKEKSQLAIAETGLSNLLEPARAFIGERGGQILNDTLVSKIIMDKGSVSEILLRDGTRLSADHYVSALPFFVLENVLDDRTMKSDFFSKIKNLESSPIFSISLWFDKNVFEREFYAMLDTHVQWLFNKGGYISLVISGAREHLGKSDQEILDISLQELEDCFPKIKGARLLRSLIQREKNATLSPKVGYTRFRLSQKTPIPNFFLCGDWTDTGYPATIESAVLSGEMAFKALHENRP